MDMRQLFVQCIERCGDRPIILEGSAGYTMQQIGGEVAAMSDLLRRDASPSGAIAILMPNTRAFIPAFYGAIFAGKIPVPLNPMLAPKELAQMMDVIEGSTLLTISPMRHLVEKILAEKPALQTVYLDQIGQQADPEMVAKLADPRRLAGMLEQPIGDVSCMLFSSGTMGRPKAVMLTHQNLIENNKAIQECWTFDENDTLFGLLPFFHSYGLAVLHLALWGGGRFLMMPRFMPGDTLRAIREHQVTILMLVPEMFKVLTHADGVKDIDWKTVRLCLTGGGPAPASLRQAWKEVTGEMLYEGYGLTEYSPVVSIGIPGAYRENSVGKPLPGVAIRIVGPNGANQPANEPGEILVKGPSVMKGYYKQPEATAEMIDAEGWLHTGDVGYVDADGFLFVSGRAKEIIIVAGENVLPQEVEEALLSHPAVAEAAVVGVNDPMRGELPFAFVVPKPGEQLDATMLRAHLRERLVSYKIPKDFAFLEQLPRTPIGKILRKQLQEKAAALHQKE